MLEDMRLSPKTGHDRLPIHTTTRFTYENAVYVREKYRNGNPKLASSDQLFDEAVSDLTNISTMKIVSVTS